MRLKIKKLHSEAKLPTRTNPKDAGLDIYSLYDYVIRPGETVKVQTGISAQIDNYPFGKIAFNQLYAGLVWDRSGIGSKGIHRLAGVIDVEEYTGEWVVCLTNLNIWPILSSLMTISWLDKINSPLEDAIDAILDNTYCINKGDKIAQVLIQNVIPVDVIEVEELNSTNRGEKGFGSSDSTFWQDNLWREGIFK